MVRRLEQLERRTEMEGQRLLEKQNRLTVKKDQLKRDLETAKRDLELSKNNEVELTRHLDEASRRIMELEEEVVEYRTKTLRLESELYFLQDSYDEAMDRERKFKDQLASLEDRMKLTDGEDDVDGPLTIAVRKETQIRGGSVNLLGKISHWTSAWDNSSKQPSIYVLLIMITVLLK